MVPPRRKGPYRPQTSLLGGIVDDIALQKPDELTHHDLDDLIGVLGPLKELVALEKNLGSIRSLGARLRLALETLRHGARQGRGQEHHHERGWVLGIPRDEGVARLGKEVVEKDNREHRVDQAGNLALDDHGRGHDAKHVKDGDVHDREAHRLEKVTHGGDCHEDEDAFADVCWREGAFA